MSNNKDAYYFSHDANALTDPKILAMRCDYGLEGYGLYWSIIEMMRNEETYRLNYNKNTFRAIKSLTNTKIEVEKYINDCVNDYELFKLENNKLFSNSLLRRMEDYDHKKIISRENGKKGGAPKGNQNARKTKENNQETTQNNQQVDLIQAETTQNNQSKVKESKVNKNKEKENTENINSADLLQKYFIECLGSTNLNAIQECISYLDDLPIEVIRIALQKTADANANWKYTKTILNNWVTKKIDSVEKVKIEDENFKSKRNNNFNQQEEIEKFLKETEND